MVLRVATEMELVEHLELFTVLGPRLTYLTTWKLEQLLADCQSSLRLMPETFYTRFHSLLWEVPAFASLFHISQFKLRIEV